MDGYFGYKPCSCCGKYADDGGYDKDRWHCLDCAEKRSEIGESVDSLVLRTKSATRKTTWSDVIDLLKEVE